MPSQTEQLLPLQEDQEETFCGFVYAAIKNAAPNNELVIEMLRFACDAGERVQLDQILGVGNDAIRGALFLSLLGSVLERAAENSARRYYRSRQEQWHKQSRT